MKRLWTLLAACAVVLAACGGSSAEESDRGAPDGGPDIDCPLDALDDADGPVQIDFWYGGLQGRTKEVMIETVDDYNVSQDRVEVVAADQGVDYRQVVSEYTRAIPDRIPNLVHVENLLAQFVMDSGTIIPGDVCVDEGVVPLDHIVPVVKAFYTLGGRFVPGAVLVSTPQLYYNKKQFEEAGVPLVAPGTLAEMRATAEELDAAGSGDLQWPVSMTINPWFFETFLGGIGQTIVDADNGHDGHATRATFDTPEALELLTEWKAMYDDGLIAPISNTPGNIDQYLNLAQGKSAMTIETSTAATTIEAFLGGDLSASDIEAGNLSGLSESVTVVPGFGPMPGIVEPGQVPVSGGAFYATTAGSAVEQAAAMDFMRYMNELPQQVKWLIEGSYLPSNDQVVDQPEVRDFFEGEIAGLSLRTAAEQLAETSPANPGPMIGPSDEYRDIMQKMLEAVFLKDADPADALSRAQADVTAVLTEYNEQNDF